MPGRDTAFEKMAARPDYPVNRYSTITVDALVFHSIVQAIKAARRGDAPAAEHWISLLERQLFCARRISGLARRQHRKPKRKPPPPSPPAKKKKEEKWERNPWVWPASWTAEQIAKAERDIASKKGRKNAAWLRAQRDAL